MCVRWQQEAVMLVWVGLFYVGHDHNMIVTVISFFCTEQPSATLTKIIMK